MADRHLGLPPVLGPCFQGNKRQKIETSDFQDDAVPWFSVAFLGSSMNRKFQITLTWTSSHKVHVEKVA